MKEKIKNGISNVERTLAASMVSNEEFLKELKERYDLFHNKYNESLKELDSIDKYQFPDEYNKSRKDVEMIGVAVALVEKTIKELELS